MTQSTKQAAKRGSPKPSCKPTAMVRLAINAECEEGSPPLATSCFRSHSPLYALCVNTFMLCASAKANIAVPSTLL